MQMNRQEILNNLKDILLMTDDKNVSDIEHCTEDTKLITDLGLSSVAMLYMVIAIEETFGIRFENIGIADLVTVKDIIDYIEGKLK